MKQQIGIRIKFEREKNGLTQTELAKKINELVGTNIKGTAIANYEAGYSIPKDEIKFALTKIFDCSLDYLMCFTDVRNQSNNSDPLGLSEIGFKLENYTPPTQSQKEQIEEILKVILKDNKK